MSVWSERWENKGFYYLAPSNWYFRFLVLFKNWAKEVILKKRYLEMGKNKFWRNIKAGTRVKHNLYLNLKGFAATFPWKLKQWFLSASLLGQAICVKQVEEK